MAHVQLFGSDEEEPGVLTTSCSTIDTSAEDIKPDLTLLGQTVGAPPARHAQEEEDSCDDDPFSPQSSATPDTDKKRSKKGSKRGGMKGLKQGVAGDDSFTISTLSAGRGQKKLQAAHLTSSLLEEVLNEKKMALLKSPDVIEQLQLLQEDLKTNRLQQAPSTSGVPHPDSKTRGPGDQREARASRHAQVETPSGRQTNQRGDEESSPTSSGGSSIWSKGGSAFTSVASTATSGPNTDT